MNRDSNDYLNLIHKIKQKKAIIWDFDGCLANTEPLHFRAYRAAFASYNFWLNITLNEYNHTFTHNGGGVEKTIQVNNLVCNPLEIYKIKGMVYKHLIGVEKPPFFQEIIKILKIIKSSGFKAAIASNSVEEDILPIVNNEKATEYFQCIVGKNNDLKKKPFPDVFLKALSTLDLKPEDALILEDSERGLEAANAAQVDAIWIQTESNELEITSQKYIARLTHEDLLDVLTKL